MPMIHWLLPDGSRISEDVALGTNLMDAAQFAGVTGIVGECGGSMSCATCQVVVEPEWFDRVGPADDAERMMLESSPMAPTEHSRLSCQISASGRLDGLLLRVPG